ncbi:hypothetical protein WOLCODRAFT_159104 [Wolfiporia cocos MD-104 SS10]|uniref:Uncharacterized protein n=1 Tax=Wolfiporia cocos (strain MD-104) TaxID=742152 RepID=A0A2H3JB81_WOLCO|nr:hypothetical protein WOLCODRAFT_159104 [Wolfiporia cocos MD-104 SS10]
MAWAAAQSRPENIEPGDVAGRAASGSFRRATGLGHGRIPGRPRRTTRTSARREGLSKLASPATRVRPCALRASVVLPAGSDVIHMPRMTDRGPRYRAPRAADKPARPGDVRGPSTATAIVQPAAACGALQLAAPLGGRVPRSRPAAVRSADRIAPTHRANSVPAQGSACFSISTTTLT